MAYNEIVTGKMVREPLKFPANASYDVVVSDIRMPGIDGFDLLKQIKQSAAPRPEVILMTAYGSIPMVVEAMKIGAFDFITPLCNLFSLIL